MFRWETGLGSDGARVEICRDARCGQVVARLDVQGTSERLAEPLAPGVYFWRLRPLVRGRVACGVSPTWELVVTERDAPRTTSWGSIFDANRDGFPDVAASVTSSTRGEGIAYVYLGTEGGVSMQAPATTLIDSGSTAYYATRMTNAGDVNGDGHADLLVYGSGAVEVYFGSADGIDATPSQIVGGRTDDGNAISSPMAAAGDVDGDGYGDVLIGAFDRAFLFTGSEEGLRGPQVELFGPAGAFDPPSQIHLAGAGDVNGDGFADLLVGAPQPGERGLAFVYLGHASGPSVDPDVVLGIGEASRELFSGRVGLVGDINGDGLADVGVALLRADHQTRGLIYLGREQGLPESFDFAYEPPVYVGMQPQGAGDLDRDGFDDALLLGVGYGCCLSMAVVWGASDGAGDVTSLDELLADDWSVSEESAQSLGDIDGDGRPELGVIVEAPDFRIMVLDGDDDGFHVPSSTEWKLPADNKADRYIGVIAAAWP
jgi:hypothetical protein